MHSTIPPHKSPSPSVHPHNHTHDNNPMPSSSTGINNTMESLKEHSQQQGLFPANLGGGDGEEGTELRASIPDHYHYEQHDEEEDDEDEDDEDQAERRLVQAMQKTDLLGNLVSTIPSSTVLPGTSTGANTTTMVMPPPGTEPEVIKVQFNPAAPATGASAFNPMLQQSNLACRMYENKYPEIESLVMVNVYQIAEMGAYVRLLEYNGIEGMILLSELSRRRIRSIQKLVRVGRNEVVVVLRVDKEKGYIDLSKRRVAAEDVAKCDERYQKSKAVHAIMRHVAEKLDMALEELYTLYGWPLYKKYGHAYEAFKLAITEPEKVFGDVPEKIKRELLGNIRKKLTPQPVKIRADIEVTCYAYEGIDAIKTALLAGEALSCPIVPIKIKLVAPPLYVMVTNSTDKTQGIARMEKAIEVIESTIKASGGSITVRMKPRAVSESDDLELAQLMARVERENAEISGDEDEEEDGEQQPASANASDASADEED